MPTGPRPANTAGGLSPLAVFAVAMTTLVAALAHLTAVTSDPGGPGPMIVTSPADDGTHDASSPQPRQQVATSTARGSQEQVRTVPARSVGAQTGAPPPPAPEPLPDAPPPTRPAGPDDAEQDAPAPVGVRIPALAVDARTDAAGLEDDGRLEVPRDAAVTGWWSGGTRPGERGPAVIVGHVDSRTGPGVFAHLHRVQPGMQVLVDREDGTTAHFEVRGMERHRKDAFPTDRVYGPTPTPRLRLITCGGEFDRSVRSYEDNVIVDLALVGWS